VKPLIGNVGKEPPASKDAKMPTTAGSNGQFADQLKEADRLVHARKSDEAMQIYDSILAGEPNNAEVYCLRGSAHCRLNHKNEALADFNKAIELNPKLAQPYIGCTEVWFAEGNAAKFLADVDKALAINPRYAPAFSARAWLFYRQKKLDDALSDATKSIELDPKTAWFYVIHYYIESAKSDETAASRDIDKALETAPEISDVLEEHAVHAYRVNNTALGTRLIDDDA
jgi:tetratricopeptide (TPR) repeat protein